MNKLKPLSYLELLLVFAIPTLLMYLATNFIIPRLDNLNRFPIEISWFIAGGVFVLGPMFFISLFLVQKGIGSANIQDIFLRMDIKSMQAADWLWAIGSFIIIMAMTMGLVELGKLIPSFNAAPVFMDDMPLKPGNYWIMAAWLPFFFFNILGEEFWWRGYIFPRQVLLNKKYTWLVHGIGWALFHLGTGWSLIFLALPIFFILPLVIQIRKNTAISILVHTAYGAFGFLSLAFGLVR